MKKRFTVAILGVGSRGFTYGNLMHDSDEFEIVSLCDCNPEQIRKANNNYELPDESLFYDEEDFFKEKRADVMVIATPDKLHVRQCVRAMRLGYNVLLEKPVSDSEEELYELLETQKATGKKVIVCHVLRYSAPYRKLFDLVKEGDIGELMAVDAIERVRYWHFAQAYVRIQSSVNDLSHPTLLAKCCHDLDYIQYYVQSKCDTVSSVGSLRYFRKENAPEGAADRCLDCKYVDSCIYSAKKIYVDFWHECGRPAFSWPFSKVSLQNPTTDEALYEGLRTTHFGKCVFKCGNEENEHVVDNQMVQMKFKNGVIATLKMLFTSTPGDRRITLFGTHGEVVYDDRKGTIEVRRYGQKPEIIETKELGKDVGYSHGGGDRGIINDLYGMLIGEKDAYTSIENSIESHLMGIKAEESRLNGGIALKVHND